LLNTERPVQQGERMVEAPPPAPVKAETPPAEPPAEAPQPNAPEAPAQPADAPAEPNQEVEGKEAKADGPAHEIPLDDLLSIPLETTVKGDDGNDVLEKPTIKELREGYMRQKDYSRKTAEVARQREAIHEEVRKGVESERAAYFQTLQSLEAVVVNSMDAELKNANWSELAANDPATYVRLDNRRKEIDRTLSEIQSKQQALLKQRETERAQARDAQAAKSWDVLEQKIPGWNATKYQTLMKAATEYGYKPEEVGAWVDHKAFEVLHDAMLYRESKAKQAAEPPLKDKRVVVVPKVVTPGVSSPQKASQSREAEAMKQLQKRGSVADAAAVIKARLG